MMDEESQSEETPKLEGPEVLYVQGVRNPAAGGQYPPTQAIAALILGILGLMGFSCCTAIPGLILAKSAMEVAEQHPGHPDAGMAKAANVISWVSIILTIGVLLLYAVIIVFAIALSAPQA